MRRVVLGIIVLVLPVAIHAQQSVPPTDTGANPITEAFRGFGYYGNWLLAAFDSIPADKYGFKPTPVQQSIGYIAQHLEDANYELCARFSGQRRPQLPGDEVADTVRAQWPKDTLVRRLRASLMYCAAAVEHVNDANLADETPVGPPGSGRTTTRTRDLILFLTDLADHYSQIANYMRILGMVPPSALPRAGG
jgi:uncharacterized damage-inducible protein DinB